MYERDKSRVQLQEEREFMIKGDLRKKQILSTAESLFAERGYEATGIQDILDVLHLSKGSFYHHFESKEQVLQKICENRAFLAAASLNHEEHVSGEDAAVRMNTILMKMIPFHGEGLTFIKMILPVLALPEGRSVRSAYQEALKNNWLPITENALQQMIQQKKAFSLYPGKTAEIALDLINDLWARIGYEIIMAEKTNKSIFPLLYHY